MAGPRFLPGRGRRPRRAAWPLAALLALGLGSCRAPEAPSGRPGQPRPSAPARPPAQAQAPGQARPQFTFSSWSEAVVLIKAGKVIQTVSGKGGFALILGDRTWVRPVARPGDPVPKNPLEFIARNAPNAKSIRHSTE